MIIRLKVLYLFINLFLVQTTLYGHDFGTVQVSDTLMRKYTGHTHIEGSYQPERTKYHEIIHTRLDIQPNWEKQQLTGTAFIKFRPFFYEQDKIVLDAKGFEIKQVSLLPNQVPFTTLSATELDQKSAQKVEYTYDQVHLNINLGKKYTRNDTLLLKIKYIAKPNEVVPTYATEKGLYFINPDGKTAGKPKQLWTQGETEGNSRWFPTIDAPNQKFTQDIHLTVDKSYKTLSNGLLISQKGNPNGTRTDHWKQKLPHAPYLVMIAVGDFAVSKQLMPDGLELSYYVEPQYQPDIQAIFGRTPEMMAFFTNVFGIPYPWEKYAQIAVRDFVSGAMENTTATVHAEDVQADSRSFIDGNSDAVIAHELAHHWFGNYVTAEAWGQLPLNESFANYAEYLWDEYSKGALEADLGSHHELMAYLNESETKQVPMIRYFYKHPDDMFDSHSYAKGGRILHMLRKQVGDEAFFASLHEYLKTNAFGTAEIAKLRIAFEKITGEDLNWFFDQWFLNAGHPILSIQKTYIPERKEVVLQVEQKQDVKKGTAYTLPLQVDVWSNGKRNSYSIVLNQLKQSFVFPALGKPDFIHFDAKSQLLGLVEFEQSIQEMANQFQHTTDFKPKYESLLFMQDKTKEIVGYNTLNLALNDSFWKFRQMAVSFFNGYEGQNLSKIGSKVQEMATSDPHPQVRAEAIMTLSSLKNSNNISIYRMALQDSSYQVSALALDKYLETNPEDAYTIALQYENAPNGQLITAVANYYADLVQPERFDWYIDKMSAMKPSDKFNMIQVFGKYLIKSDPLVQMRGIPVLEHIARTDPSYFVRFGAFQSLGLLVDTPIVLDILKDIKSKETDSKLIEIYKQIAD